MGTPRTLDEITAEWNTRTFGSPGTDGDRSALLDEMLTLGPDHTACELVNQLEERSERDMYSFILVMKMLTAKGPYGVERARAALILLPGMDQWVRFTVNFEIYTMSRDKGDLGILRTTADHIVRWWDKAWAYLMIHGLTLDRDDLFLAGQAMRAPAAEPRFSRPKK